MSEHRRTEQKSLRSVRSDNFDAIRSYVDTHFLDVDITVRGIAERFFISERSLCRLFRRRVQMSPIEYIEYSRVEYAKFLLLAEHSSVEHITSLLGYQNSAQFRKLFARFTGTSPSAWRRENSRAVWQQENRE